MKLAIIRGAFANPYELQNYETLKHTFDTTVYTSHRPLSNHLPFKTKKLLSPYDLPDFSYKIPILNRIYGDSHYLTNLEQELQGTDIAYVAETYYGYTQQAIAAKKKGYIKKVVSLCWETIPHNNEGIRRRKEYKQNSLKNIDWFICPTQRAKGALLAEGFPKKKIIVIPLGVNTKRFKTNKKRKNKNILFIGRLETEKGVHELLHAFLGLYKKYPDITLTIIGKGSQERKLRTYILHYQLTDVVQILQCDYSEIPRYYFDADIFVLPSKPSRYWEEQYGMVLIEAMASGLPVVTTTSGAIPEVVGNAAILCKPGNCEDLANKIELVITNAKLRTDLSKKALLRIKNRYNLDVIAAKFTDVFLR